MGSGAALYEALAGHAAAIEAAGTCYVGFSGGLDSTVLLHLLAGVHADSEGPGRRLPRPARLRALHANHNLHTDAGDWERHCRSVCAALGVVCESTTLTLRNAGEGLEAAARDARYRWFAGFLAAGDCLLLAHHQDDQAETLLLRLLRGAGPDGLAGMPARRRLGEGELLRPLLTVPRRELRAYARERGLAWLEDPSNSDVRFDRNYLRQEILPRLEARWPGYRATLSRAAQHLREASVAAPCPPLVYSATRDPGLPMAALGEDRAVAATALRAWLRERGLRMPGAARLGEFLRQLAEGQGARLATGDWVLQRYREGIYVRRPDIWPLPVALALHPGADVDVAGSGRLSVHCTPGDEGRFGAFRVRFRRGGESLCGPDGHRKDLKTVFQEGAVPPWWRDRVPLLYGAGAREAELLAVGPFARSARAIAAGLQFCWEPRSMDVD
jgi:tRNA(Ile)-lysidine synthase